MMNLCPRPCRALIAAPVAVSRVWLILTLFAACIALPGSLARADDNDRVAAPSQFDSNALRDGLRQVITEARDRVFPALVSIRVVTVDYRGGREIKATTTGSGTIISAEGHVLTNQHVTARGRSFVCTLADKREVDARLVGEDPLTDLAILELDAEALDGGPLAVARFGDSDALEVGDYVMAMGSPFALSRSVSLGIVSNTERVFAGGFGSEHGEALELEQGQRTGLFTRWIQHDALINPGNSGGPLVDLDGSLVGVNELGSSAMGFAIPSNLAQRVTAALIEHGEVLRSFIGASFEPIRRSGHTRGVLIDSVVRDGPAAVAGIVAGDLVVTVAGDPITVRFPEEVPLLLDRLTSLPIGSEVILGIDRSGEIFETRIRTEKLARDLGDQRSFHAWGLTAQDITPKMARDAALASTDGVLITGARQGGPAQLAEPSLGFGDVVQAVGGQPVADLTAMVARFEELAAPAGEKPEPVLVEFDRRGKVHVTLLEPRSDDSEDPPRELPKAWVGVATQPLVPRLAEALGLGDRRGFRITRVYPKTEAASAGLLVGDVVVAIDDQALEPSGVEDSGQLSRLVRSKDIGTTSRLQILRDGVEQAIDVMLERTRLAPAEARSHRNSDFELTVRELTFFDRDEYRWDADVRGVWVVQADGGGWARIGGIRPRDLIQAIDGHVITSLPSFRKAMKELELARPARVSVSVLRGAFTHIQYLEPEWTPADAQETP